MSRGVKEYSKNNILKNNLLRQIDFYQFYSIYLINHRMSFFLIIKILRWILSYSVFMNFSLNKNRFWDASKLMNGKRKRLKSIH